MSNTNDIIYKDEGLTVEKFVDEQNNLRLRFSFNQPEAVGTIDISAGAYGLWVNTPVDGEDQSIALIDLFYASPEGKAGPGGPPVEVITYDPENDDHHMKSKYYPGKPVEFSEEN